MTNHQEFTDNDDIIDNGEGGNTVYIRRVEMDQLPAEVRQQAEGLDSLYAVHGIDGERLALVKDRKMAFFLARENDLAPVSVH